MVPCKAVTDAVGPRQPNRAVDVALIQDLLARSRAAAPPAAAPPAASPLAPKPPDIVDGFATDRLFGDIIGFQKITMKTANPDGVVSPGGPTLATLLAGAGAGYKGPAQFLQSPTGQWETVDQTRFLSLFATQFTRLLRYNWTIPQPAGLRTVLQKIVADASVPDIRWAAYMLTTVQREASDFLPIEEGGKGAGHDYGSPAPYVGKKDKKQYKNVYYGRGYVQLTWLEKYLQLGEALGIGDALATDPARALDPDTAYTIMSKGMVQGLFTSVGLSNYITGDRCDYRAARAIINGSDMATEMAACAGMIEGVLWLSTPAVPVLPGAAK
jgi:hypothetical protein